LLVSRIALFLAPPGLAAQQPHRTINPSLVIEQFDVLTGGNWLIVPVTFQKNQYLFTVDTGATMTVYDESLENRLRV
jgi:hypothetical protein